MDKKDQSRQEKKFWAKEMMIRFNLIDSYRLQNTWGGFTWGRDNPNYIRSRLDMILMPTYAHATFNAVTITSSNGIILKAIFFCENQSFLMRRFKKQKKFSFQKSINVFYIN